MKIYISINENGRVQSWGNTKGASSDVCLEVEESHEILKNPFVYTFVDGVLQKDAEYQNMLIQKRKNRVTEEERITNLQEDVADLWYALMTGGVV